MIVTTAAQPFLHNTMPPAQSTPWDDIFLTGLSADEHAIWQVARDFRRQQLQPVLKTLETGCLDTLRTCWKGLSQSGLTAIPFPESFGGADLIGLPYFVGLYELAKSSAALATALSVHSTLVGRPMIEYGTPEQQVRFGQKLVDATTIGAFALTEANAGSDAGRGECKAERQSDGSYVLNGSKLFITNALVADIFLVTARTSPKQPAPKGLTAFIVERGAPGFSIAKGDSKMGLVGGDWGELVFTDCPVPALNRLGDEGQGFKLFMNNLNTGRISIAAISCGIAAACIEACLLYTQQREQFGKPLSAFQATQFKLADMMTELSAAQQLLVSAARLKSAGLPYAAEASMAKLYASEMCNRVANQAVQLHGGYGYTTDFPVERYFRDARVMTLFEGTSEIQKMIIGKSLLGG